MTKEDKKLKGSFRGKAKGGKYLTTFELIPIIPALPKEYGIDNDKAKSIQINADAQDGLATITIEYYDKVMSESCITKKITLPITKLDVDFAII